MAERAAKRQWHAGLVPTAASTLLYTLSQPPFDLGWLALVALTPMAFVFLNPVSPPTLGRALVLGLAMGEATTLAVGGHWLFYAAHSYFGKPLALSAAFTLATTLTHAGLFIGLALASTAALARLPVVARVLGFSGIWVGFELLRSEILYGCPWDLLGHGLHAVPSLAPAAELGGVPLLSGACALTAALLASAAHAYRARRGAALALAVVAMSVPAALAGYGLAQQPAPPSAEPAAGRAPLRVGLVQANVGRHDLWDRARSQKHLDQLLELSGDSRLAGADLIVWPENAVPFLLDADADARRRIQGFADSAGSAIALGATRSASRPDAPAAFFNSVYLFKPGQPDYEVYDKRHLLPYIEATPGWAADWLPRSKGIEYSAGDGPVLFEVAGWKLAPMICFESTYPRYAREAAREGAQAILNLSNDSWFDRGAAPEQHFAMTTFRSIETGLPLIRAANTGVSAVIDGRGRTLLELPSRRAAVGIVTLPAARRTVTAYSRYGDRFALGWAMIAALLAAVGLSGRAQTA